MTITKTFALSFLSLILLLPALHAEEIKYKEYDWNPEPKLHQLSEQDQKEFELVLKEKKALEFAQNGIMFEYYLVHKIIRVNSDEAIEMNNRVYIPLTSVMEVLKQKARVIKPDGTVIELDEDDIKEAEDEEDRESYKYFALEGVEKGSEIEYFYLLKMIPMITGSREIFQSDVPKRNVTFELISPNNLEFASKSLNGCPELMQDTTVEDKNILRLEIDKLPAIKEERMAAYKPNLMQLLYKIDRNTDHSNKQLFTYSNAAEAVYEKIYLDRNKKTDKGIKKMMKNMDFSKANTEVEKARVAEDYLKTNFAIVEANIEGLSDIEKILDQKICSKQGMTKLFTYVLDMLAIEHQVVLTSNRFTNRFDPDFESYHFLQNYLIYLPKSETYIAPEALLNRIGIRPFQWSSNYGLFIKPVELGNFKTGVGIVKYIDALAYDKSTDDLDIEVNFGEDFDNIQIDLRREMQGYYAQNYQPLYDFIKEEDKKEFNESLVKFISEEADIKELNITNQGMADFGVNPFVAEADITSDEFIEKAGQKYLFKVGNLIGPQMEMYQEEERKFGVENNFNRKYLRKINFDIPKGYKISNLDALNMDVFQEKEGERTMAFTSTYTQKDNRVEVVIQEYYKQIRYPVEEFEDFRKVINAAADFNKVVLFIEQADEQ